jgi:hypothetical protein
MLLKSVFYLTFTTLQIYLFFFSLLQFGRISIHLSNIQNIRCSPPNLLAYQSTIDYTIIKSLNIT